MLSFLEKIFDVPERIDRVEKTIRKFRDNCHDGLPNFLELRRGRFTTENDKAEVFKIGLVVLVVLDLLIKEIFEADFEFGEIVWLRNIITLVTKALLMCLLSYRSNIIRASKVVYTGNSVTNTKVFRGLHN
jgi:hypothetical protein